MVALVTGASGFLGRAVSSGLAADGWTTVAAGRPDVEIPSPELDLLLERTTPALVVHCAGPASVPDSIEDPVHDFAGSAGVLVALLDQMRRIEPPPRLLFISSAAVYGQPARLPVAERDELKPVSPYGFHRVACELVVREFHELWGTPAASLRVFSAYGEGLRRQIMWDICSQALDSGEVRLHGTGRESRDFVHASDVARSISVVARAGAFEGEVYNVGSGVETKINELARLLIDGLGSSAQIAFCGRPRRGDPENWRADIAALSSLGFEPEVAIEDGARTYAAWAREELIGR